MWLDIDDDDDFGCAPEPQLICSPSEQRHLEICNVLNLGELSLDLSKNWSGEYKFTPDIVREFNRVAMNGIYGCAGEYRTTPRVASSLVTPKSRLIPGLVDEMCKYVNASQDDPFHAAAFLLWRTNWIHPFHEGNGRTSRELCYLALLIITKDTWAKPLPSLIKATEIEMMAGLQAADREFSEKQNRCVAKLESYLSGLYTENTDFG